jgi:hypothetical protein
MKPEDEVHAEGSGGSRDERRGGAMMCRADYNLARISGMVKLVGTDPVCDAENLRRIGGGFGRYGCMK